MLADVPTRIQKSNVLDIMILKPWFSFPKRFETGTSTSSNSMYVEPVACQTKQLLITQLRLTACRDAGIQDLPPRYAFAGEWDNES